MLVAVGWIPPDQYDALTLTELDALITEINRQRRAH